MINVSSLSKSYGAQTLFTDVTFKLDPGERYGLVGANGSGKTTLLNILSGFEESSGGTLSVPRRLKLGVLRQDQFHTTELIIEAVRKGVRITEVPVTVSRRLHGDSKKGRNLSYGYNFARTILKTWFR